MLVEINLAGSSLSIREVPKVTVVTEARTGKIVRKPMVDAQSEIERAWKNALAAAPKPDAQRLQSQIAKLSLDVDPALEQRTEKQAAADPDHALRRVLLPEDFFMSVPPGGR